MPVSIKIDKSGANTATGRGLVADSGMAIELRQSEYRINLVEQDHRAIKRRTRQMMGFKPFWSVTRIIAGIETMHMDLRARTRLNREPFGSEQTVNASTAIC